MRGADWSTAGGGGGWSKVRLDVVVGGGSFGTLSVNGIITLQPPPPLAELGVTEA